MSAIYLAMIIGVLASMAAVVVITKTAPKRK